MKSPTPEYSKNSGGGFKENLLGKDDDLMEGISGSAYMNKAYTRSPALNGKAKDAPPPESPDTSTKGLDADTKAGGSVSDPDTFERITVIENGVEVKYFETPWGRILDKTDELKREDPKDVDWSKMNFNAHIEDKPTSDWWKNISRPEYFRARHNDPIIGKITVETEAIMKEVNSVIKGFYDGSLSADGLQAEYERLAEKYADTLENHGYPIKFPTIQGRWGARAAFYDEFRHELLSEAVDRNNAEGKALLTGNMNAGRTCRYYNSDYYYKSEEGIEAITKGAFNIVGEKQLPFEVPDYKAKKLNLYYNFNSAWCNNFELNNRYMDDPDQVPPRGFKWFYESGGEGGKGGPDPGEPVNGFDPGDCASGRTWVSFTDKNAALFYAEKIFSFDGMEKGLQNLAKMLTLSTGNPEQDRLLNNFMSHLWIYPTSYYNQFWDWGNGVDVRV